MKSKSSIKEILVENYLVKRAQFAGGVAYKLVTLGTAGFPDRSLYLPGGFHAVVEVKRPQGGVYSEQQKRIMQKLIDLSTRVYAVSTCVEADQIFDDYQQYIEGLKNHDR